jgi:aquaporin related protein
MGLIQPVTLFLSEMFGTAMLLFLGCMGCVHNFLPEHVAHLQICLNFGLAVMISIQTFGVTSGSHINPAVSLCAAIYGSITYATMFIYMAGQFIGAFLGYGLVRVITPESMFYANTTSSGLCMNEIGAGVSVSQAVIVEFIITSILCLVCCGVWDPRNANHHDSVQLKFGLTITCLALSGAPYSGGSMNPARSLAPALWHRSFDNHWIYWIGPFVAAVASTYLYKYVFWKEAPKTEEPKRLEELKTLNPAENQP